MAAMLVLASGTMKAQQKVADKELQGVWLLESYVFDGESKIDCGEKYTRVKVYRPDGEYACAQVVKRKDNTCQVIPHEYGTYTFKDGEYTEMGRKTKLTMIDKNTCQSRWTNCDETWKKCHDMPAQLTDYVVNLCKANQTPSADLQKLIRQHMFK